MNIDCRNIPAINISNKQVYDRYTLHATNDITDKTITNE